MSEFETKKEVIDFVLKKSKEFDFNEFACDLLVSVTKQLRFYDNKISISKIWNSDKLQLFASTVDYRIYGTDILDVTPIKIEEALKELKSKLDISPPNPFYEGLAPYTQIDYGNLNAFFDEKVEDLGDYAGDKVMGAINSALEAGANKSAGLLQFDSNQYFVANSHGLNNSFKQSNYQFTIRSFVDGESTGQGVAAGRDISSIENKLVKAGDQAGRLAKLSQNATMGKGGQYDLVLSPTVAANIFGGIIGAANPISEIFGFSPFKDKVGEQLAPDWMTVTNNSRHPEGPISTPFDFEGHKTGQTNIIENGIFKRIVHSYSTSKKFGGEPTGSTFLFDIGGAKMVGPSTSNVFIDGGNNSLDELLDKTSDRPTLYITSNWYTRFANYVETEFSSVPRDAILSVENGELTKPVKKIRISDNILGMMKRIVGGTKETELIWWWEVEMPVSSPAIRVEDVRITTAGK
ncbi:MAG: TldD/PmbA family protein [Candidatus Heimdallarchaeota archaeon]|nr:TldD/PmbA family protein [Candidatus Heimdallarchaeota archaeon]MDH5645685.1 TldD/PmbA family protein [Candidatus Heimdallarchaeota archaeon]